jgi:electron transfer flavoprotein alpha subunit
MARILVVGEVAVDGSLTKLSTEVATLGRRLAEAHGGVAEGIVPAPSPTDAATELATYLPTVFADAGYSPDRSLAPVAGGLSARAAGYDVFLLSASPDGRDIAGTLSALTGLGVLANATDVRWTDDGPVVVMSAFGGKLMTESAFTSGKGVITVRPNSVTAEPLATPGAVHEVTAGAAPDLPAVAIVDRVEEGAAAVSIDDARIIVAGGRGVGGADGFGLIGDLAEALGGAVGATRAAVDSGWIPYGQQIGQTGKIVKPQLYLAMGISGAIQHKVGMQTASTIIAVNRDPDAPIADFADMVVVGDLFAVGHAILAQLRERSG